MRQVWNIWERERGAKETTIYFLAFFSSSLLVPFSSSR